MTNQTCSEEAYRWWEIGGRDGLGWGLACGRMDRWDVCKRALDVRVRQVCPWSLDCAAFLA